LVLCGSAVPPGLAGKLFPLITSNGWVRPGGWVYVSTSEAATPGVKRRSKTHKDTDNFVTV
jgi:hypothetical protein